MKPDDAVEVKSAVDENTSRTDATESEDDDDSYAVPEEDHQLKEECKKHFNTVLDFC